MLSQQAVRQLVRDRNYSEKRRQRNTTTVADTVETLGEVVQNVQTVLRRAAFDVTSNFPKLV